MTADQYQGCDCGGAHHTTGTRAWCLDCREWCYPASICEVQALRAENEKLRAEVEERREAMRLIEQELH